MSYFDPYDFYDQVPLSDENYLSGQLWDLYAPTSDTQAWNRINAAYPYMKGFSTDALLQSDPLIRGIAAQAVAEAGSGPSAPFKAYNLLQSEDYQNQLQDMLGRTEWDQIAQRGDIGTLIAEATGDSQAIDQAAMDYTNSLLEDFYAQAAPSASRNLGMLDEGQQRFGGRPYPGGEAPQYSGPAFSAPGMGNAMQDLMTNPAYANAEVAGVVDPSMLVAPDVEGQMSNYIRGSQAMYGGEPILDLGEANIDKDRIERNAGPEGYSTVAVIGGRKFALPDTLPGSSGTSISYMDELRRRAAEANLEVGFGGELSQQQRGRGGRELDEGSNSNNYSPLDRLLDRVPGVGQIRQRLRDWLPRGIL